MLTLEVKLKVALRLTDPCDHGTPKLTPESRLKAFPSSNRIGYFTRGGDGRDRIVRI